MPKNPYELGQTVPRALAIEPLRAPDNFKSTAVFAVEDMPGVYREVARDGRKGLTPPPKDSPHVLAMLVSEDKPPRPAEFVRWTTLENMLAQLTGLEYVDEKPPF